MEQVKTFCSLLRMAMIQQFLDGQDSMNNFNGQMINQ